MTGEFAGADVKASPENPRARPHTVRVARSVRSPLVQIERDLLAEKPLDTLLRKLLLIGGAAGSLHFAADFWIALR